MCINRAQFSYVKYLQFFSEIYDVAYRQLGISSPFTELVRT